MVPGCAVAGGDTLEVRFSSMLIGRTFSSRVVDAVVVGVIVGNGSVDVGWAGALSSSRWKDMV